MNQSNGKLFALGHAVIPFVLLLLYAVNLPLREIPVLTLLTLGWTLILIWQAFISKNLYRLLRKGTLWCYIFIDCALIAAIYTIPSWYSGPHPTWLILFLVPFYAAEVGMVPTTVFCLLGIGDIYLYNLFQSGQFASIDTALVVLGMVIFVTLAGRATDRLNRLAYIDSLTQLPNRMLFKDRLIQALDAAGRNKTRLAVIFIDLDQFKYVNDTMGHAMGDFLLKTVAARMRDSLPREAVLSRMGGDEFTILLPDLDRENDASEVAENIIQVLKESIVLNHHEVYITSSIGIALYPYDGMDAETLMKNADVAMYRAKEYGRNNYQFHAPPANAIGYERITMETMLRHALERDEFVVYYQPRVHTLSGKTISIEALVRWVHPEIGIIGPKDFIPLAEETGLIVPIGVQVMKIACTQLKQWHDIGHPTLRLSVNLSARQFRQRNLPEVIFGIMEETELSPTFLELEITESIAMQNVSFAISMLSELKEMGLSISIDDFGTGYSSLNYLKRFPIDALKIDRSFTSGIHNNSDDAAIVKAIIGLAQTLKLRVTAEGVETMEQLLFLHQLQCHEIQGFLFAKPMPAKSFENWMRQGRAAIS